MEENSNGHPRDCFTNADRIREFHEAMGANQPTRPVLPDKETLILRQTLIDEEYEEVTAVYRQLINGQENDIAQLVHELTDLLYVAYGAILACGVNPDPIFAEVHRANMQKMNGPRRADGKILKPAGWQPADVRAAIERQSVNGRRVTDNG
ncbi:MAG: hypothetical protein GY803_28010 [Chloroflexi bacterium]|nr:hypothetical protein [Chloroflexota bacterium]